MHSDCSLMLNPVELCRQLDGWVTICEISVLYSLGSQAGVALINQAPHLYYKIKCCM